MNEVTSLLIGDDSSYVYKSFSLSRKYFLIRCYASTQMLDIKKMKKEIAHGNRYHSKCLKLILFGEIEQLVLLYYFKLLLLLYFLFTYAFYF